MTVRLQELIHKYEVGTGYRTLTYLLGVFVLLGVALGYNFVSYRNLATPEGMDAAQLARNLAEGRGFTTDCIRPLSLYLLQKQAVSTAQAEGAPVVTSTNGPAATVGKDWAQLQGNHPDLANPPVYPLLLAAMMKLMPAKSADLTPGDPFRVYRPDMWIGFLNQGFLIGLVGLVYWLARRLFDTAVAWMAATVTAGTEVLWGYSLSGLPTILLMVILICLAGALALLDIRSREDNVRSGRLLVWAALAGVCVGLGGLTRYSFGWLIIPAAVYVLTLPHAHRGRFLLVMLIMCGLVMVPWLTRNFLLCGAPFGTAGFAIYQGTAQYSGVEIERLLAPEFGFIGVADYWLKLLHHGRHLIQRDLLHLAGSWITPLFLAGLLVPFRNPSLGRVRWFTAGCLVVLGVAQALGRTSLVEQTDDPHADHLLVIAAPLVFIYGTSLFFNLLDQFTVPSVRYSLAGMACVLASLPLLLNLVLPGPSPVVYPPYYPPWIQAKSRWINAKDWMASDVPWAVAWYGHRQAVWLPFKHGSRENAREDFYALNQVQPLKALYLTSKTLEKLDTAAIGRWRETEDTDRDWTRFQGLVRGMGEKLGQSATKEPLGDLQELYRLAELHWIRGGGEDWDSFVVGVIINQEVPTGFPLKYAPTGLWPEIFLTENEQAD